MLTEAIIVLAVVAALYLVISRGRKRKAGGKGGQHESGGDRAK